MNFGVFNTFFEEAPHYLVFLSLSDKGLNPEGWGLPRSINKMRKLIQTSTLDDIVAGMDLLLQDENWRMHLVAAIVLLYLDTTTCQIMIKKLWNRISIGSWVSPQILVILSIVDKHFINHATKLIEENFKITYTKQLNMFESHNARGPAGKETEENKVNLALEYLLYEKINDRIGDDNGGTIAKGWKETLENLISKGLLSFPDNAIFGGPDYFISYYQQQIKTGTNTYWTKWIPEYAVDHPYWLQWLIDKVSPCTIHFLHGLEYSKKWKELKKNGRVTKEEYDTLFVAIKNEMILSNRKSRPGIWIKERSIGYKRKKDRWVKTKSDFVLRESMFPELWFLYRYWGNDIGIIVAPDKEIWEECPLFSEHERNSSRLTFPLKKKQMVIHFVLIPVAVVLFFHWILKEVTVKLESIGRFIRSNRIVEVQYIEE